MFACRYAILRFLPYVETGEFANVGIVLTCESNRHFGFRLLNRRVARISRFFELSDTKPLRAGLRAVAEELERIQQTAHGEKFDAVFAELVRPRETVFRFDVPHALMTADPEMALNDLFARYVEHDFDARVPYEVIMERDVHQLLAQAHLGKQFMAKEIGDDDFQVKFPFVREQRAGVRIIKPLHLMHTEQVRAIEHGLLWAARVMQLKKRNLLQGEILFTLQGGQGDLPNPRVRAEVEQILREVDVKVVDHDEKEEILTFARAA